jgi:hypothetical protein
MEVQVSYPPDADITICFIPSEMEAAACAQSLGPCGRDLPPGSHTRTNASHLDARMSNDLAVAVITKSCCS